MIQELKFLGFFKSIHAKGNVWIAPTNYSGTLPLLTLMMRIKKILPLMQKSAGSNLTF